MTSTSTLRAALPRLINHLAVLALLLVAGGAYAQGIIYVDTGGSDAYSGTSPNFISGQVDDMGRPIGPVRTVDAAIVRVNETGATEDVISIEANGASGSYAIPTGGFDSDVDDITFTARNSGTFTQVRFTGGGTAVFTADDLAFTSSGGTFLFDDVDFEDGDVDLGTGVVAFVDNANVEVTSTVATGNPTYIGSVYLLYNGDDDFTTGALLPTVFANGSTLEVALNDGGDTDLTLTFDKDISFRTGDFIVQGENNVEGQTTVLGVTTFDLDNVGGEAGNAGDIVIAAGTASSPAIADFSGTTFPEVDSIFNEGTLNFSGTTLQVLGDFINQGTVIGGNIDLNGSMTAEFAPGPGFTINRLRIGNGPNNDPDDINDPKVVTFTEDVILAGNFVVFENATAQIEDQAVTLEGTGNTVIIADGGRVSTDDDGALIFAGDAQEIQGDGMFGNLTVATTDTGIIASGGELEFDGTITLASGGIDIVAGDLSPAASNTDALVVVNFEDTDATILAAGGTFNAADVDFDLSYFGNNVANNRTAADEFDTDNLRDLLVRAEGTLDASGQEGGDISGNVTLTATTPTSASTTNPLTNGANPDLIVIFPDDAGAGDTTEILGSLVVNNDVRLDIVDDSVLSLAGAANTVNGEIEGDAASVLLLQDGVTITSTPATNAFATLDINVELDEDANVTIANPRTIDGTIVSDGDDSLLTLGLGSDNEFSGTALLYGGILNAGNVTGDVALDGGLTLTRSVEFLGDVNVEETLTLGANDLLLTTPGIAFDLDDITEVVATTGAIAFYGNGSTFDGDDASVPNLRFSDDPRTAPSFFGDSYQLVGDAGVTVTNTLRVNAFVATDADDDEVITLVDGGTYVVDSQGGGLVADAAFFGSDPGLVFAGDFNLFVAAEIDTYGSYEVAIVNLFNPGSILTLGAYNSGSFPDYATITSGGAPLLFTFNVQDLTVRQDPLAGTFDDDPTDSNNPTLNLAGHDINVSGDVTMTGSEDYVNVQFDTYGGPVLGRGTSADPIAQIAFVGDSESMLNTPAGVTTLGDGVDYRIAKSQAASITSTTTVSLDGPLAGRAVTGSVDMPVYEYTPILDASTGAIDTTTPVTLNGGAIAFDDQFDTTATEDNDDETLILQSGIFVVGTKDNQQSVYVRLDHENSSALQGFGNTDNGQGFVFANANGTLDQNDASTVLPNSYIGGNVRKRVANIAGLGTPGRVIYPTGEKPDADDMPDYGPFVFDFESSGAGTPFGARQVNVTFVGESPGQNDSLPLADNGDGTTIEGVADFYWLVSTTGPAFGQGTTFNIEARSDDYEITGVTDDLELVRRQAGDVGTNNYVGIGGDASVFQIDLDGADEGDPADDAVIVQESVATTFLGPQGTIITFGLAVSTRPVATDDGVTPTSFALNGNVPNPFRTRTALSFDLSEAAEVSVDVYDTMGRRVASIDKGAMSAGADQRVEIDGTGLASGVYVFRLTVEGATETIVRTGQITLTR
ncbi:T9SS type A sorting domain-containing protein [Rubrivirga sp. IMCC45206]|uniref:T9SS type A sorting domain-containing protein n=1 Tax=Rubrivirga sp. IMCC45206 TaxID=3391614 RepID=UPI00398FE71A